MAPSLSITLALSPYNERIMQLFLIHLWICRQIYLQSHLCNWSTYKRVNNAVQRKGIL